MNSKNSFLSLLLLLMFLATSNTIIGQQKYFKNTQGNLWSTPANWNGGTLPISSNQAVFRDGDINVDADYIVKQLNFPDENSNQPANGGHVSNIFSGNGLLSVTGTGVQYPFYLQRENQSVTFNNPVRFIGASNATGNQFKFNKTNHTATFNNSFTIDNLLTFIAGANKTSTTNFNHSIIGNGEIKFGVRANATFGPNYDGSNFDGIMNISGGYLGQGKNVTVISNVSDGGIFLRAGGVLKVTNAAVVIEINGVDTFKGNINTGNWPVALNIDANQSSIGLIAMGNNSARLNVAAGAGVTSIKFADQNLANWGSGKVQFSGVGNTVISFGTDQNGLTAAQLSQITLDGVPPQINNNGELFIPGGGPVISTFNNAGGNGLWSNAGNWTNGVPDNEGDTAILGATGLIIDGDYLIGQLKTINNVTPDAVSITQTVGSLTIVGKGFNQPVQSNKVGLNLTIDADIIMDSSVNTGGGGPKDWRLNASNQVITFAAGKTLSLITSLTLLSETATNKINFNGTLAGDRKLKIGSKSNIDFGPAYSGASHTGAFEVGSATLVSNVTDNGTFINNGRTLTVSNQGASITVNGANTLKGNINTGNNTASLVINKNQSAVGIITMGTGGINLSGAAGVTSIAFADNSTQDWGTGTLAITGFADNEVSFGTDANGLTTDQLAQITYNGCTEVTINENGQLSGTGGCPPPPAPGNRAPTAGVDYVTVVKNKYSDAIEVLKNDIDLDGDEISLVSASSNQSNGIIDVNVNKGTIVYIPAPEFTGSETIIYTLTDGKDESKGLLYVTVEENTIPIADPKSVSTTQEISVDIDLSGSDANSDSLFYVLVDNPTNGVVSLSGDGKTIYTPNSGFFGSDSFTFKVNDGMDDSSTASVTINVTSNDTDNDGVLNDDDLCPDTPAGTAVNVTGCPVFKLPDNNNKIEITSASCVGSNDGSLKFSITDSSFDYSVRLIGLRSQNQGISNHEIIGASNSLSVTGLSEGLYSACFLVNGQPGYEQCFEVLIEQPQPLSAFIGINESSLTTNIELEGSDNYNIEVNGAKHDVRGNNFTAALRTGINNIKVSTDKNCQGLVEKQVFLSEEIQYYPNPTISDVNVHVSGKDKRVIVSVYSIKGELIYSREQEIEDFSRLTEIDLESQITGTYMVTMESETVRKVFKIVKE